MEQKKLSPLLSAIFSVVSPGLGQIYNGQLIKGQIIFCSFYSIYFFLLYGLQIISNYLGLIIFLIVFASIYLCIILDSIIVSVKKRKKEKKLYNRWYFYILYILSSVLIYLFLSAHIEDNFFRSFRIPTASMSPTLLPGDYIVADMSINPSNVKAGDVIIFSPPHQPGNLYLQRCVALSGQKIDFIGDTIMIDGEKLKISRYDSQSYYWAKNYEYESLIVPVNSCYVLGDNYFDSADSRYFGCIPINLIAGKPLYIYWSERDGRIGKDIK